ncbi:MAG: VCBS repeat-containing protein [Deltaproteobacteria bacterium]|nr:VCBS repeat-containing protein [Deltaproteobacteria bacterium]
MEHAKSRFDETLLLADYGTPAARSSLGGRAARTFVAGALAALVASPAAAALREYRMQFQPSPTTGVAGYTMHLGTRSGTYVSQFDLGMPPASGGTINYALDLEDSVDLYVALRAYSATGAVSSFSSEVHLAAIPAPTGGTGGSTGGTGGSTGGTGGSTGGTGGSTGGTGGTTTNPPGTLDPTLALGVASKSTTATISRLLPTQSLASLSMDSLASRGDVRPASCDLDDDGDLDLVLGFGDGSNGTLSILTLENGAVTGARSLQAGTPSYRSSAGRTLPTCGDLDGDGRAEILVGFGAGMRGVVQVFDDVSTNFAPLATARSNAEGYMQIPVPSRFKGTIFPAIGDIDGDGKGEVVVGMSNVRSGMIVVLDDSVAGFALHAVNRTGRSSFAVEPSTTRSMSGGLTIPAMGDIDGDGLDEVVVGFGSGSRGRIAILEDAVGGWPTDPAGVLIMTTGRSGYQSRDGATRPALGDVDGDGVDELVVGFMRNGDHEVQVFDDLGNMLRPIGSNGGFVTSADTSLSIYPAPAQ